MNFSSSVQGIHYRVGRFLASENEVSNIALFWELDA
jgi:hypothetical protein